MEEEKEKVQSKCGICVAHSLHDAYSFIKSLQHRGREACGIAAIGNTIDVIKWKGGVGKVDLLDLHKILPAQNYKMFMAHVRYATQGREDRILEDSHPHVIGGRVIKKADHMIIRDCDAAIVHNGQINLKLFNEKNCDPKEGGCDTKIILKYYWENEGHDILKRIPGSYTLAIADRRRPEILVMRDRFGVKPGVLGLKDGKYCVASEDISLVENGAKFIEDLKPGSVYYLSVNGGFRRRDALPPNPKHCFFEWNYIADVDSMIDGISVRRVREELGKELAREFHPNEVDVITFLPRCPEVAARAYARFLKQESKFCSLFYKLRGERSFQGTNKDERKSSIKNNLHLLPEIEDKVKGKIIVIIDDSTIRGNNSAAARELLKAAGAKKISLLNYTPKIGIIGEDNKPRGCLFGVDMPIDDDFVVRTPDGKRNRTTNEINQALDMNVYFLSPNGLFRAFQRLGLKPENLCSFCIGGKYPFAN